MKIDGITEALQNTREEITSVLHSALDGVQKEITNRLEYVLAQSTDHRQCVESSLKETRNLMDQLQSTVKCEFENIARDINSINETTKRQVSKMAIMISALVAINIVMAITLLAHSL